jgi:hypothetical protein
MGVTEIEKLIDPCAVKHGGNEQSREANKKNLHHRTVQRQRVLDAITQSPSGLTMKELAAQWGVQFSSISGRGSELKKMGLLETTGEVRAGSAVLQATGGGLGFGSVAPVPAPVVVPTHADATATALETVAEWFYV